MFIAAATLWLWKARLLRRHFISTSSAKLAHHQRCCCRQEGGGPPPVEVPTSDCAGCGGCCISAHDDTRVDFSWTLIGMPPAGPLQCLCQGGMASGSLPLPGPNTFGAHCVFGDASVNVQDDCSPPGTHWPEVWKEGYDGLNDYNWGLSNFGAIHLFDHLPGNCCGFTAVRKIKGGSCTGMIIDMTGVVVNNYCCRNPATPPEPMCFNEAPASCAGICA